MDHFPFLAMHLPLAGSMEMVLRSLLSIMPPGSCARSAFAVRLDFDFSGTTMAGVGMAYHDPKLGGLQTRLAKQGLRRGGMSSILAALTLWAALTVEVLIVIREVHLGLLGILVANQFMVRLKPYLYTLRYYFLVFSNS